METQTKKTRTPKKVAVDSSTVSIVIENNDQRVVFSNNLSSFSSVKKVRSLPAVHTCGHSNSSSVASLKGLRKNKFFDKYTETFSVACPNCLLYLQQKKVEAIELEAETFWNTHSPEEYIEMIEETVVDILEESEKACDLEEKKVEVVTTDNTEGLLRMRRLLSSFIDLEYRVDYFPVCELQECFKSEVYYTKLAVKLLERAKDARFVARLEKDLSYLISIEAEVKNRCYEARDKSRAVKNAEAAAVSKKVSKAVGLKALTGTAKQKIWAETIRAEFLKSFNAEDLELIAASKEAGTSKFWIENREIGSRAILKLISK